MTISSDDLVRVSGIIVGMGVAVLAAYDAVASSGTNLLALPLAASGLALSYSVGSSQDSLRRRDTQVVAYLANNPAASLPAISAATGLPTERALSSLRYLLADGLVVSEAGQSSGVRSYRLAP
ncbi:MarR family transcriptional regulator [Streptomyces sp. NPDC092359]|uniref:MarR family transcriptional regulator n=1 Tax=Streptomyces sp. NPDC092359 TaxID=3366014 RepID=UPI00380366B2